MNNNSNGYVFSADFYIGLTRKTTVINIAAHMKNNPLIF